MSCVNVKPSHLLVMCCDQCQTLLTQQHSIQLFFRKGSQCTLHIHFLLKAKYESKHVFCCSGAALLSRIMMHAVEMTGKVCLNSLKCILVSNLLIKSGLSQEVLSKSQNI